MSFFSSIISTEYPSYTEQITNYTITSTNTIIGYTGEVPATFTLPASSTSLNGKIYYIKDEGGTIGTEGATLTIQAPSGTNLNNSDSGTVIISSANGSIMLINDIDSGWYTLTNSAPTSL